MAFPAVMRQPRTNRPFNGRSGIVCAIILVVAIAGCSGKETCDEPEFYEYAQAGKRIEAPDDLNSVSDIREMRIPEASPRAPRDPGAGCLDRPPSLNIDEPETETES